MGDFWDPMKAVFSSQSAVLAPSTVVDGDPVTGDAVAGFAFRRLVQITLEVTPADGDSDDKLDVYVDRSVDGAVWTNAVHFPQVLGDGGAKRYLATLDHTTTTAAATTLDYSGDAAANVVRPLVQGDQLRVRLVPTFPVEVPADDPAPSFTASVVAIGE